MTSLVEIRDLKVEAKTDSGRRIEIIRDVLDDAVAALRRYQV